MAESSNPYRLPDHAIPSSYRIHLEPDLDAATFVGHVEIDLELTEAASVIVLNAADLEFQQISAVGGGVEATGTASVDEETERATITLDNELPVGPAVLRIAFTGILNDKLRGFYRSEFTDDAGTTHRIATTQFESTDARRAFPCFDEPAMKATYEVTLVVPSHLSAFSNSPVESVEMLENGRKKVAFSPTMKMSTYLVAFVVGPFEATDPIDVDGIPLSVVYAPGKAHLASYALKIGAFALRFFQDYFDIPYPGDKVDLLAIPDFAAGAMENLGCITFRETALLVDPASASLVEVQRVATVVAHELAHMWFGDLVTMDWWEGIWLNEAFATFMEELCCDAFEPEWQRWIQFGIGRDMALTIDSLHTTRPIEFEVVSPNDAEGMFDLLTYEKGGSVLRMLEQYLGAETFRDGIRRYLKRHSYANTVTTDLWNALEEASGQPVAQMMNTWILQGGHPVVTLENGTLSQSPFSYTPKGADSSIGEDWLVPVLSREVPDGPITRTLLSAETESLTLKGAVTINAGGHGVYRSDYANAERVALLGALDQLDELERTVLVNDTWAMTLAGRRELGDLLELATALGDRVEPSTWTTISGAMDLVWRAATPEQRAEVESTVRRVFGPRLAHFGYDAKSGEAERTQTLRGTLVNALGTIGADPDVRAFALERFDSGVVEGDLARAVLATVGAVNRPGDYDEVLARYRAAKDPQSEQRYRMALAQFCDDASVERTFDLCFSEFRLQDVFVVIIVLIANRAAGPKAWELLSQRWGELQEKVPPKSMSYLADSITTFVADRAFAEKVAAFHRANPVVSGQRSVEQSIEQMLVGVDFAERVRPGLLEQLARAK